MKMFATVFACFLLLSGIALAQTDKPAEHPAPSAQVLNTRHQRGKRIRSRRRCHARGQVLFRAYNGEFKGVRTFAPADEARGRRQLHHGRERSWKRNRPSTPAERMGQIQPRHKADIMKYLKDSFAYIHKAAGTIDDKNLVSPIKNPFGDGSATRLALAVGVVGHCFDHYGQMVEYLRMNGIVPPASRQ